MHPFTHWWKSGPWCGPHEHGGGGGGQGQWQRGPRFEPAEDDGGFGVRRPLRFMAHHLELTEHQVGEMAAILSTLKNERAQAVVDGRRSVAAIADALAGGSFDLKTATGAVQSRVVTAERMRDAVLQALQQTHALLTDPQRQKLAFLLRSGQLVI